MNKALRDLILRCAHNNGHENYGEGNICVECRAKSEDIREAEKDQEFIDSVTAALSYVIANAIANGAVWPSEFSEWEKAQRHLRPTHVAGGDLVRKAIELLEQA